VGWVEALRGSIVALDTAPLIYFIERDDERAANSSRASWFLTNDERLSTVPDLSVLVVDSLPTV
jgi:hypothetical protein